MLKLKTGAFATPQNHTKQDNLTHPSIASTQESFDHTKIEISPESKFFTKNASGELVIKSAS